MRASPHHKKHLVGIPRSVFIAVGLDCRSAHCGHPRDGNLFVDCEAVTWQDAQNERSESRDEDYGGPVYSESSCLPTDLSCGV